MKKFKTIVDREYLSSDYIESRQNFGQVLNEVNQLKPPVWKSAWFYGPVGISVLAVVVSIAGVDPTVSISMKNSQENPEYKALIAHVKKEDQKNNIKTILSEEITTLKEAADDLSEVQEPQKNTKSEFKILPQEEIIDIVNEENIEVEDEEKYVYTGNFPNIEGVFNGDITLKQLLDGGGITSNPTLTITSFTINYFDGNDIASSSVNGNKIPLVIGEKIKSYNIGEMIYITDIKAEDEELNHMSLSSLNLVVQK
ncbi:MAG: hypothetical protein MK105_08555 [Crocinitomicaceae bacterium]|nr:hypothetical protein [Crocinitomicaceae bacterium]